MPLTQDLIPSIQSRLGLSYHVPYLLQGENIIGLKDMKVLEVGGSLPRELVIDILGAKQWVGLEAMRYWEELGDTGGGTRPSANLTTKINNIKNHNLYKLKKVRSRRESS